MIILTSNSPAGDRFVAAWTAGAKEERTRVEVWTGALVDRGITLAHPDDGWVDRSGNSILFVYPTLFAAPPAIGSLVALGTHDRWRLVRLTRRIPSQLGNDRWGFEVVPDTERTR